MVANSARQTAASSLSTERTPRGAGRPSLFTPELAEKLCAAVRQHGWSESRAALLHGVNPKNLPAWKRAHEQFALDLEIARTEFLAEQLAAIEATASQPGVANWRARAWLLERAFPEEYGRRAALRRLHVPEFDHLPEPAPTSDPATSRSESPRAKSMPARASKPASSATPAKPKPVRASKQTATTKAVPVAQRAAPIVAPVPTAPYSMKSMGSISPPRPASSRPANPEFSATITENSYPPSQPPFAAFSQAANDPISIFYPAARSLDPSPDGLWL